MYFKKILFAVVMIGLIIVGYFAYYIYTAMLAPNTAFNNEEMTVKEFIELYEKSKPVSESLMGIVLNQVCG